MEKNKRLKRLVKNGVLAFVFGLICGAASCTTIPTDKSLSAAEGNSKTAFLSGCGQEPLAGRVYCEIRDGANSTQTFTVYVPPASCKRDSCVSYQFLRLDGSFGPAGSIAKGKTFMTFPLSYFAESANKVSVNTDGEYQLLMTIYYIDSSGVERKAFMKGLIRVVVTAANFVPMGCGDPAVAWTVTPFKGAKCRLQWSSALRSAKCGKCGEQS